MQAMNNTSDYLVGAIRRGDIGLFLMMYFRKDIDFNLLSTDGTTPLIAAFQQGEALMAGMLLANSRVNKKARDIHGRTAFHYARAFKDQFFGFLRSRKAQAR